MEKILLDTDIGSDIDDAVCLAYLLMQPECDLLGVTTVTGESDKRASMVSAICNVAGRKIPIIPGADRPLIIGQIQPDAPQTEQLINWPHQVAFPDTRAIDFMADKILSHPGEVTLLTIGALTNVALLFAVYPEVIPVLKQLVMMCGIFSNHPNDPDYVDWNTYLDPHAAKIVYSADVRIHKSVGEDVTSQVKLVQNEVSERFKHPLLMSIVDFAEIWFKMTDKMYFHDPLAAVSIFEPNVCTFQHGLVSINLDESVSPLGVINFDSFSDNKPHQVATDVDIDHFFESFFAVFD